jgi:hypothetical protein
MLTGRFPTLRRCLTKMIEIAGAGCASAIAAFLLGNSHEAERPPVPVPPAVVHLAPADEQMIRHVRDENAALAEQLRNSADARSNTAGTAPAPASAPVAQKPAKAASNAPANLPARREQKTTRSATVEAKQRPADPPPVAAAVAPYGTDHSPWANARSAESKEIRVSAPAVAAPAESSSPAPAQVPSRLWPAAVSSVRDAPRPPVGVGEFTSSSM